MRGISDGGLTLFWFDPDLQRWQPLSTEVDSVAHVATAQVDHFTIFTLSTWSFSVPGNGSSARTTTTTYDSIYHVFPTSQTNALGHVEAADYDWFMGTMVEVSGPNANLSMVDCKASTFSIALSQEVTCASYDVFGRLQKLVKPGDSSSAWTLVNLYYDWAQPFQFLIQQRVTSAYGDYLFDMQQFYDGMGRQVQEKRESTGWGGQNIVIDTRSDALGRITNSSQARYVDETSSSFYSYTAPTGGLYRATSTIYDGLGRIRQVLQPDGSLSEQVYTLGSLGSITTSYDANHHATAQETDSLGRLRRVYEYTGNNGNEGAWALEGITTYSYDALDRLTQVQDALGNLTAIGYDSLGRKTSMADPDMGPWSYSYDVDGQLISQVDARMVTTALTYDAIGRLRIQSFSDGTPALWSSYDESWSTNGIGRRTSTCRMEGSQCAVWQSLYYDGRGRLTAQGQLAQGVTHTLYTSYDSADRPLTQTYAGGEVVTTSYDTAGRPLSLCSSLGGCYVSAASATALDQPASQTMGNGLTTTWSYSSPLARLASISVPGILNLGYGYDAVGNITTIWDNWLGQTQSYSYDQRDRLKTGSTSGAATGAFNQSYSYNVLGNLTNKAGVSSSYGSTGQSTGIGPHQARQVGNRTLSYDMNGNLLSDGQRQLSWNALNQVTSITTLATGVTETYGYDTDGQRVSRTRAGQTTLYAFGVYEQSGSTLRSYYSFRGQPIAVRDSVAGLSYLYGDHLGSVGAATSASGSLTSWQRFDPWGSLRASSGSMPTQKNFTGQYLDDTGLLFYHARYYDPGLGRFVSADTIAPVRENPQTRNRYSYVLNNPLKFTDPSGHCGKATDTKAETQLCEQYQNELRDYWVFVDDYSNGLWSSHELRSILQAIHDMATAIFGGSSAQFRSHMGTIGLLRASEDSGAALSGSQTSDAITRPGILKYTSVITFYKHAFGGSDANVKRLIVHELGHAWDIRSFGMRSQGLVSATGSSYEIYTNKYRPGGTTTQYAKDHGHLEDWAESVAETVYNPPSKNGNASGIDDTREQYVRRYAQ